MRWMATGVSGAKHLLLTSDRPVIMTNGLAHTEAHIELPISKTAFFLATRTDAILNQIKSIESERACTKIDNSVCKQAIDYVYAVDDRQATFIVNRFGSEFELRR